MTHSPEHRPEIQPQEETHPDQDKLLIFLERIQPNSVEYEALVMIIQIRDARSILGSCRNALNNIKESRDKSKHISAAESELRIAEMHMAILNQRHYDLVLHKPHYELVKDRLDELIDSAFHEHDKFKKANPDQIGIEHAEDLIGTALYEHQTRILHSQPDNKQP